MDYDKLQQELLLRIPEISENYQVLKENWNGSAIPNYVVFEDLFVPFVENQLLAGADSLIRRLFGMIEQMSKSKDQETKNLVYVALFEGREKCFLDRWIKFSGRETLKLIKKYK